MNKPKKFSFKYIFKWFLWIVFVQIILINISAAIYAYKFTHFYKAEDRPLTASNNIFAKTWTLFAGPTFYKQPVQYLPNFTFETIELKTENDVALSAWYSAVDSAKGCVVFFHGVTANKTHLLDEATAMRNWGYNVMLVDFRGHGNSEGAHTTFGVDETEEVTAAFNYAKEKGNRRIVLYGSSLGSVVVIKATSEGLVKPVAIIADMPFGSLQDHLKARARTLGFPRKPFAFLVTGWMGAQQGYNGFNHTTHTYAKGVHCPMLLQWGVKDHYVTREETEAIYTNLGGSKKLVVYPQAGHESFLRHDPVTWQKEVNNFLAHIP